MTNRDADICEKIRRERRFGNTRSDVVEGKMTVVEVARAFGLADDSSIYRTVGSTDATAIALRVLCFGLAHPSRIMSNLDATDLWQQFMSLFDGNDVEFASNTRSGANSWSPATSATFDMGLLVVGGTKSGCLWVQEED